MNGSLMLVMKSLESAPLLKSLPSTVLAVQTEVAELASKLADLELQLTRSEKEVAGAIDGLKQSVSNDKVCFFIKGLIFLVLKSQSDCQINTIKLFMLLLNCREIMVRL